MLGDENMLGNIDQELLLFEKLKDSLALAVQHLNRIVTEGTRKDGDA